MPIKALESVKQSKKRRTSESDHSYAESLSSGVRVKDDSTTQYVEVGAFHDSTKAHLHYIYLVNRRGWTAEGICHCCWFWEMARIGNTG